jgi:hypothetical protein
MIGRPAMSATKNSTGTLFEIGSLFVYTRHPHAGRHRHFLYRAAMYTLASK